MTDKMTAEQALAVAKELRDACVGHPHAKIPWPHRLLHHGANAIEQLAALTAPRVPEGYDWVTRSKGYEDGVNEMACELKQLCKDFSDLRDRPYMGDVLAQIDAAAARCLEEIPSAHKATAAPAPAGDDDGH